ncbi:MAG: hypothetical protein HY698_03415 [Deltaproteobacteria bacterium]|nr:hypothetical protein [Deltaproteobacteria bacterium]
MIHLALHGSLERFFAVLIEHYAGAFPLGLAPVQVRVLTASEKQVEWASTVEKVLRAHHLRVESDLSLDKLGAKIRCAQVEKNPVMSVCGDKEVAQRMVSPRTRDGKQAEPMPLEEFARYLVNEARILRGGVGAIS